VESVGVWVCVRRAALPLPLPPLVFLLAPRTEVGGGGHVLRDVLLLRAERRVLICVLKLVELLGAMKEF
jgi:hypothetical protein